jgi:GNAT superfamily N-acetyltransferase
VDASLNPVAYADLPLARTGYGLGTAIWAGSTRHQVEDDWWIALSQTAFVDYNLALIHGERGAEVAPAVLDEVLRAEVPSLIMLAGAGLAAADPLREAGWVCIGARPFMGKDHGPAEDDPHVRRLERHELAEARRLTSTAFGVPDEVGAIVFAEDALEREDCRLWGLFEDGTMLCCLADRYVDGRFCVCWALATAPQNQRAGYGRRLLRASAAHWLAEGIPVALLMATDAGKHLYEQEGYVTLEHWQIWSRPRWVLR